MTSQTTKIPAYFSYHWEKDGTPTGSWWHANIGPEQEIETTMLPCVVEKTSAHAERLKKIDLSKFVPMGQKLSWRQRFKGIL